MPSERDSLARALPWSQLSAPESMVLMTLTVIDLLCSDVLGLQHSGHECLSSRSRFGDSGGLGMDSCRIRTSIDAVGDIVPSDLLMAGHAGKDVSAR